MVNGETRIMRSDYVNVLVLDCPENFFCERLTPTEV